MRILVTAGPTREPVDPVRFISNYSTGRMGYTIAGQARERGHKVILISGPTHLIPPRGIKIVRIETARDMQKAVQRYFPHSDALVMAAAVADYRPRKQHVRKLKKDSGKGKTFKLILEKNPDILAEIRKRKKNQIVAGFALETENLRANARYKLAQKGMDLVVGNQIVRSRKGSLPPSPFGEKRLTAVIIDRNGRAEKICRSSKKAIANILLQKIESIDKGL